MTELSNNPIIVCTFLVLLLPLLSFILSLLISARFSWLTSLYASVLLLVSSGCAIYILFSCWNKGPLLIPMEWFHIGQFTLTASIQLSNNSLLMLVVVSSISALVHVYSIGYMAGDPHIKKYFAMLGFFTFSMQGIVLADDLLLLFVFWELVGFSSYMLIGHWMTKPAAAMAARKAFLMNRIGDVGFLVGLMIIWTATGSLNITNLLNITHPFTLQTAASLCIFCGVIGKSAQLPLSTWLPDAMEGPTPVSALIHAATMVAAGVYLLIRLFPVFTADALAFVALTGMLTAVFGSLVALFQFDLKKILAYSTISQLGLMIMALGAGAAQAALLHLFTHAFFKACLFLSAGSILHTLHQAQLRSPAHFDEQDIRNMGGLRHKLPVTFLTFLISGASLAGVPFFSGFLSKEAMLAATWTGHGFIATCTLVTMIIVSFITVLYSFRLIWNVFMGVERKTLSLTVMETPMVMRAPAILLAFFSLWFIVSWNPFDFRGWLLPSADHKDLLWITLFSVAWISIALIISYSIFRKPRYVGNKFLENGFYLDCFYHLSFGKTANHAATAATNIDRRWIDGFIHAMVYVQVTLAHASGWIDKGIIDGFVNGFARLASSFGSLTRSFQGGKIQLYIFWAVFGIIIFLIWTIK